MNFGVFLFILTPISCVLIFPGSAEAYVGWGGKCACSNCYDVKSHNYQLFFRFPQS